MHLPNTNFPNIEKLQFEKTEKISSEIQIKSFAGFLEFCLAKMWIFFDFAFLCATLKVDSARSTCGIDMVDSAFERV